MSQKINKKAALLFVMAFIVVNYSFGLLVEGTEIYLISRISFQIIASAVSIWWIFLTFKKTKKAERQFWLFLCLGSLSYLTALCLWSYDEFTAKTHQTIYNLSGTFWICQNIFYLLGLLLLVYQLKSRLRTMRLILDILIIMSVAAAMSWRFILTPLLSQSASKLYVIKIIYPILDLGVLFGVLSLLTASHAIFNRKTKVLLIFGLLLLITADTIASYLTVLKVEIVGSNIDILWGSTLLLIGLSGLYHEEQPLPQHGEVYKHKKNHFLKIILPYSAVVAFFIVAGVDFYKSDTVFLSFFMVILLIIIRQIFTLFENEALFNKLSNINEHLEQTVKKRTEQLEETLHEVEHIAYQDMLTGLPNRRLFEKEFSDLLINKENQFAVMMIDIDRFKNINDNLGHSFGDLLLQEVGERLRDNRGSHCRAFRIGGDEFSVLIKYLSIEEAEKAAMNILAKLRKPYTLKDKDIHITPSIGIALYPSDGTDFDTLLTRADLAMYEVKKKGKNDFLFYDFSMKNLSGFELENSLHKAIEREEFVLYYQPQVSINTNEMVGAEALIRWNKAGEGLILPDRFIPLAEESGFIKWMGEWVLRAVCRQIVDWQKKGISPVKVAINISPMQFQQTDFVETVESILIETGADPKYLELEITESVAMENIEYVLCKLSSLKKIGFSISIDDFGTGYSSLKYLSQLQIDKLKIDRSFVASMEQNEKNAAIVRLTTLMAKELGMKVIAEGVENNTQAAYLKKVGCEEFQGYLFSPPLPKEQFEQLLVRVPVASYKGNRKMIETHGKVTLVSEE
ncbi:putative bifunctional diguanylate cyclase/phosphodiesterase [Bacillus aerolatus]|nr:GGDEF domain-containing phosphodiesterase [Bacillus aerolatus]